MSNEKWIIVCFLISSAFYVFGLWRGNEDAKRKNEELKRMRNIAKLWESDAHNNRNLLYMEQRSKHIDKQILEREKDALKSENGKLKKQYADELQKRLELAELVKKHEKTQKDVDEVVTEAFKNVNAEVSCGEVSAGD